MRTTSKQVIIGVTGTLATKAKGFAGPDQVVITERIRTVSFEASSTSTLWA